jgi:hypothetical protein
VGKVMRSPPQSILALFAFSASVALTIARIKAVHAFHQAWQAVAGLVQRFGSRNTAATPVA